MYTSNVSAKKSKTTKTGSYYRLGHWIQIRGETMNRSLYSKFILGYLLFGLLGFVTIATLSSHMVNQYLVERHDK